MKTSKLFLIFASAALFFTGCEKMPTIDKEYNPAIINVDKSSVEGDFRQGDEVTNGKIIISYANGLGRSAKVFVPPVNGVYSEPILIVLAPRTEDNNGNGTIEIPLKGVVDTKARITLRPTIELDTHEVFIKFEITPTVDIVTDAAASTTSGTFKIFQPIQNGKIGVKYSSTKEHKVKISVAEVVGISASEFEATLPAAPNGGMIEVPLSGTPSDQGNRSYVVRMIKGEDEYNVTKSIEITGEISFNIEDSTLDGDFIVGQMLVNASILLKYVADRDMSVNINITAVDGISSQPHVTLLSAGSNTIPISLIGTPTADGVKTLTVTMEENNIIYSFQIPVTVVAAAPGVVFAEETVIFSALTYKTVFVDVNGNGFVNPGEVWLDRNIGATSNAPGAYGVATANADSFGHFMQWGKPYDTTTYDGPGEGEYGKWAYKARGASFKSIVDDGTIAPTAAGGSFAFTPEESYKALVAMKEYRGGALYSQNGFYDSFNHGENWIDSWWLGIDQGPIVIMIENYRTGLIWDLMKENPYIVAGLKAAGFSGGWINK